METVIPPRDHDPEAAYQYRWDGNGEITRVTRIRTSVALPSKRARRTMQWPYEHLPEVLEEPSEPASVALASRRKTWQPRGALDDDDERSLLSPVEIPDYVVNYLRGETPESIAQRKRDRQASRSTDSARFSRPLPLSPPPSLPTPTTPSTASTSADDNEHGRLAGRLEKPRRPPRGFRWRQGQGWRGGAALVAVGCFAVLLAAFACLMTLVGLGDFGAGSEMSGASPAVVFAGSCGAAAHVGWGLHALLSVCAVVLLAGANYVVQVLSSPTRAEVAAAHSQMAWLDIGIPSVRNWASISGGRVVLSVIILVAVVSAQVIYNALIFTSLAATADYQALLVMPSFLAGSPFSNATANNAAQLSRTDILALQNLAGSGQLVKLTGAQCAAEFSGVFDLTFQAVLVVLDGSITGADSIGNSSLVQTWTGGTASAVLSGGSTSGVAFCLAQPADAQTCTVGVNSVLLIVVVGILLIALAVIAWPLHMSSFEPLVTLGDALASFLRDPDPTTRDACLMTKKDVWYGRWGLPEASYWVPADHYWLRTPSTPRWVLFAAVCLVPAALAAGALALSVHDMPGNAWVPFGTASPGAVYTLRDGTPAVAAALVAALPQLLLAALYLAANSLLTTYFLSHESSLHSLGIAQPLRVSADPLGAQTTSLFLTLPPKWSALVVLFFAGLSFTLSQAVVVVQLGPGPSSSSSSSSAGGGTATPPEIGFSPAALVVFLALLAGLALLVLGLGARRAPPTVLANGRAVGNPLALPGGSCSAVLSARCHPVGAADARDAWRRPVMWGVVQRLDAEREDGAVGHCTYSARQTARLETMAS